MFQKIILFSSLALLLISCGGEANSAASAQADTPTKPVKNRDSRVPMNAVDEDDIMGRMAFGIKTLQEEFDRSSANMRSLGKVTVSVDERANFVIKNEVNGEVKETRVNLRDLDTNQGAFRLIPDTQEGEAPGLLIQTIQNKQKVEHLVDGKVRQRNSEIQIFMMDRTAIERITPAILQTIRLAKTIE